MFLCQRIAFLSCCQIQQPPPAVEERRLTSSLSQCEQRSNCNDAQKEEEDEAIFNAWAPLSADTHSQRRTSRPKKSSCHHSSTTSIWLCPEIDRRIRVDRARRLKAARVVEQMDAMVQAAKKRTDGMAQVAKKRVHRPSAEDDGTKRKRTEHGASKQVGGGDVVVKPQSLLIPELLPKEMRVRTQARPLSSSSPPAIAAEEQQTRQEVDATDLIHHPKSEDIELDLGLDLGFSVSKHSTASSTHSGPRLHLLGTPGTTANLDLDTGPTGSQAEDDVTASILEIASFLKRDVDVFTPLSATTRSAPRSSAFAAPLSSPAVANPTVDSSNSATH